MIPVQIRFTSTCTIGDGIFSVYEARPSGIGVIDSFVRVQNKITEQGYNTSYRDVQFDEKTDPNFTRDVRLTALPRPEPATLLLVGAGLIGCARRARKTLS